VARNGPPDDFHNQQTQYADYGGVAGPPPIAEPPAETLPEQPGPPEEFDTFDQKLEPTPWYRKPAGIITWVLAVLILIALIVYGLMELLRGGQRTSPTPAPTSSTTPTATTTTPGPATTTTSSAPPPTSGAVEPPVQQPTQQPRQPTQQQPTHRHHLPQLPSVITIPEVPTVITLPPGLP
jgi:hypothetical protein